VYVTTMIIFVCVVLLVMIMVASVWYRGCHVDLPMLAANMICRIGT
jgi:hypothetical protein